MENKLVYIKTDDVFTDSLIIAERSDNEHKSVKQIINDYKNEFKQFGTLTILKRKSSGGRPEQYYLLNEMQATFLMTLLRNSETVVQFKIDLIKEFYRMRRLLMEKQTADWQQSRLIGKQTRKNETDIIMTKLIPHAESQGSKNAGKLYMTYSKLVNMTLGIQAGERNNLPLAYIDAIRFMERAIENIISIEVDNGTNYKEIYQICKAKCGIVKELSFLPAAELLAG